MLKVLNLNGYLSTDAHTPSYTALINQVENSLQFTVLRSVASRLALAGITH